MRRALLCGLACVLACLSLHAQPEAGKGGLFLRVQYPDKTPAPDTQVDAAFLLADEDQQTRYEEASLQQAENGLYWITEVPKGAHTLVVMAIVGQEYAQVITQKQWPIKPDMDGIRFDLTIPKMLPLAVRLIDADGLPVRQTSISGLWSYSAQTPAEEWPLHPPTTRTVTARMEDSTDDRGIMTLNLPGGKYTATFFANAGAGRPVVIDLTGKTPPASMKYTLDLGIRRTVTQAVFRADGTPARGAQMQAVCSWRGRARQFSAVANEAGVVTWTDLPPVRGIVWGDGIAPGLLSGEVVNVTTPLPSLPPVTPMMRHMRYQQPQDPTRLRFTITNPGNTAAQFRCLARGLEMEPVQQYVPGAGREESEEDRTAAAVGPAEAGGDGDEFFTMQAQGTPGQLFSLVIAAPGDPPRTAWVARTYLPFADDTNEVEFPLVLRENLRISGRFTAGGGATPAHVTLRGIEPVSSQPFAELVDNFTGAGLTTAEMRADKTFLCTVPCAGEYRLHVDMFDGGLTPPPSCMVQVAEVTRDVEVKLPTPLTTVPGGAEVSWLTKTAPGRVRGFTVAALAPTMPIYGDAAQLLAYWYQTAPNRLVLWRDGDPAPRELTLRQVRLEPRTEAGPCLSPLALTPLVPQSQPQFGGEYANGAMDGSVPYNMGIRRWSGRHYRGGMQQNGQWMDNTLRYGTVANLWPGRYLLATGYDFQNMRRGILTVPETGEASVALSTDAPPRVATRQVRLQFPPMNVDALREQVAQQIQLTTEDGFCTSLYAGEMDGEEPVETSVPVGAKKMTLQWTGMGVMRDVALPASAKDEDGEVPVVKLPKWQPGITVSGRALTAEGKPLAGQLFFWMIGALNDTNQQPYFQSHDENQLNAPLVGGAFNLTGMIPGVYLVRHQQNNGDDDYNEAMLGSIYVGPQGAANVVLRREETPLMWMVMPTFACEMQWWVPDQGRPVPIMREYEGNGNSGSSAGTGWIWGYAMTGDAGLARYTAVPGANQVTLHAATRGGVSITMPFAAEALPGSVTFIGTGNRTGLIATFPMPQWQSSPELGLTALHIGAVPPGVYRVRVAFPRGSRETTVTITEDGGYIRIPAEVKAAEKPAARPAS